MSFWKVVWSDIRSIWKNSFLKMALVGIILLPLAYGGLYLAAFWDPYSNTENLPIAVVNLDKGGIMDDSPVNYGDDIVSVLKNNDDLGWNFVKNLKDAKEGVEEDKYYAMVVIPKDFTQKITEIKDGMLRKPKLIFITNKKKNYIVGLICDKAAKVLKENISEAAMDTFTETIFDNLYVLKDGLETATDGTAQMKDGVTELKDKVPVLDNALGKLYDGASTLNDKLGDAYDGSTKLRDGVDLLRGKMPDLVDGVSRLRKGAENINENIGDAYDGSVRLRNGAIDLYDKLPDLSDNVEQLYDGTQGLKEGIGQVDDNMPKLLDGVWDLRDGAKQLNDGLKTMKDKVKLLYDKDEEGNVNKDAGLEAIKTGTNKMKFKIAQGIMDKLNTKDGSGIKPIDSVCGGLKNIYLGMEQIDTLISSGKVPISDISKENWKQDMEIINNLNNLFNSLKGADASNRNEILLHIAYLLNGDNLDLPSSQLSKVSADLNDIAAEIQKSPYFDKVPDLQKLYGALKQLSKGVIQIDGALDELKQTLAIFQGVSAISGGVGQATTGVGALVDGIDKLYKGSKDLYDGLDELYDKTTDLKNGIELIYSGSQDLRDGADKFQDTVPTVTSGVAVLTDGTRELSDGLFKLNRGTENYVDKIGELSEKIPDVEEGINELYDGSMDLSDGIIKLRDGSGKIKDGLQTMKDKMPDLQDGADKLYGGVAELNSKLGEGAEKIADKLAFSSKAIGSYMGDPMDLRNKPLYAVDKYGVGLAPYFISLGLWVGALMMFFFITDDVPYNLKVGSNSVILGKYLICCAIGALQAVLLSLAVIKLGLTPANVPLYIGFNIFLSFVFIAIAQNLIFLLGDIGRVSVVLILLLQLTASGGTFPRELIPSFFKKVNPFIPFTYSISAMREIILGANLDVLNRNVFILLTMLLLFLILSFVLKPYADKIKDKVSIEKQKEKTMREQEEAYEIEQEDNSIEK
ncbi:ABC-2 family transporter protein [Clostridium acetireducens DSM 10703]|uniref:ABC-2 family transporter protein n=1 Tax=Clostridium acetireducens DSM 10703 TaxID=1121290 RepID=A0A1E8EWH8_9CLOT|nr:YhgE/Pip domain-containing protein [Clostridium acetireducens]OFI04997.1 ABC-2 family transporter protein [Clostridium acetireducens DSM 10703]